MAERPIVIYGDPVLREESQAVDEVNQEVKALVSEMVDTLKKAKGLGLAANQVGVAKRVFILDLSALDINESVKVFINPEITWHSDEEVEMEEGCLSFPDLYLKVVRPKKVRVRALDLDGVEFEIEADGMVARAVQHENDHINGRLFIDRISSLKKSLIKGRLRKLAHAS